MKARVETQVGPRSNERQKSLQRHTGEGREKTQQRLEAYCRQPRSDWPPGLEEARQVLPEDPQRDVALLTH